METKEAVTALAALAQETRLSVVRLLIEAGPEGMSVGSIGEKTWCSPCHLVFSPKGTQPCGSGDVAPGKPLHLLHGPLRANGGADDVSHPELLQGHAAGVPYSDGNGA